MWIYLYVVHFSKIICFTEFLSSTFFTCLGLRLSLWLCFFGGIHDIFWSQSFSPRHFPTRQFLCDSFSPDNSHASISHSTISHHNTISPRQFLTRQFPTATLSHFLTRLFLTTTFSHCNSFPPYNMRLICSWMEDRQRGKSKKCSG